MPAIFALAFIADDAGNPVPGRGIMLQGFGKEGWTDLLPLQSGDFQSEVPARNLGTEHVVPLRLVDRSTQELRVIADNPMLHLDPERNLVLADFGHIQLLPAPFFRRGRKVGGERVVGMPLEMGGRGGEVVEEQPVILRLRAQLAERDVTLTKVRGELSGALEEVHELSDRLGTETKVIDVIAGLGTQLSATNEQLATQPTPFRLANVRLDLRGRLGGDGQTIVLDGKPDGSGITADLITEPTESAVPQQPVPGVVGLTESAAARVLRSVGLRMESATQQLAAGQGVPGQAVAQHPAAGTQVEYGSSVLVVFVGKE
ncbi:MAG: PASTA domain-containing protein [Propionibacterium sp.]|nr:PASTA domain-containing protein [Propionibacterium sp.]